MHVFPVGDIGLDFHFASAFIDAGQDRGQAAFDIDQHIGMREIRRHHHGFIQAGIGVIVGFRHGPLIGMHFGKNTCVLIDRTVLHKAAAQLKHLFLLLEAFGQEIDLQMKTPPLKIMIKLLQVRVMIHLFQRSLEVQLFRQGGSQRRFTDAHRTGYCDNGIIRNVVCVHFISSFSCEATLVKSSLFSTKST
ncbi:hypothetical protein D3C87_1503010 [compost metagenome]